jgi:hypothetical protein
MPIKSLDAAAIADRGVRLRGASLQGMIADAPTGRPLL